MSEMYLMTGISGSGKTSYATALAECTDARYLSIDNFYNAVYGDETKHGHEFDVWMMFYKAIELAAQDGVDVIIDTNAPTVANRNEIYDWFGHMFNISTLIYMDTPIEECKINNKQRTRVVPNDEMERMINKFEPPTADEYSRWSRIVRIKDGVVIGL